MKKIFFLTGLIVILFSCNNSETETNVNKTDTSSHTTYSTTDNNVASGQNHMKAMHDAMDNSMRQMHDMKPTGDPDYDFAMMMKYHHQGVIDMAKAEVAGGTDEQLKQMAQKMINDQQREKAAFDRFIQDKQPTGNSDYGQRAMGMMTPTSAIKMDSGSLDAMFASMMVPHHLDAIKMAQEYLKVGKDAEMKKIAQSIIENQPKEIQALQNWLANRK